MFSKKTNAVAHTVCLKSLKSVFLNLDNTTRSYPHPKRQHTELPSENHSPGDNYHPTIDTSAVGNVAQTPKRKNVTPSGKRAAMGELIKGSNNGALRRNDLTRVTEVFEKHPKTITIL